jgi:hypothetical protein
VYVEGAYRHVTATSDITVRVHWNSAETGIDRQLGGAFTLRQKLASGWSVGFEVDKLSLVGKKEDWSSFATAPVSLYGFLEGPGFELRAGGERGGFQAELAADLGSLLAGLGVRINVAVDADRSYRELGMVGGTW